MSYESDKRKIEQTNLRKLPNAKIARLNSLRPVELVGAPVPDVEAKMGAPEKKE